MHKVQLTDEFRSWLMELTDKRARMRIVARIRRAELGNLGEWGPVGGKLSEMRVDTGPGYRLYFTRRGKSLIVLLAGGDKSSQQRDIKRAQALMRDLRFET